MAITKTSQTLGVQLKNDIVEMIERRATALGVTKSRYAAMLLEHWRDNNYPAISTVDSTARAIVFQGMSESGTHKENPSGSKTKGAKTTKKKAA